jgi:acetyl esterase/lipase
VAFSREAFVKEQATAEVRVQEDIRYANDALRRFDLYLPAGVTKPPLLVLVAGRNDIEVLPDTWGNFISRARLFAAAGYATVMFNHGLGLNGTIVDGAEDVEALLRHVRAHGDELGVDASRVTLVVFGMASTTVAATLRSSPEWLQRVVLVAPYADLEPLANWQAPGRTRVNAKEYSLPPAKVPMLIVRSGKDDAAINGGIDRYVAAALAANAPLEVVNHPEGDPLPAAVWRRVVDWLR